MNGRWQREKGSPAPQKQEGEQVWASAGGVRSLQPLNPSDMSASTRERGGKGQLGATKALSNINVLQENRPSCTWFPQRRQLLGGQSSSLGQPLAALPSTVPKKGSRLMLKEAKPLSYRL